jgi:hypothetical protein
MQPPLTPVEAEAKAVVVAPRSLSIPDPRGRGATLRVTRHPEQNKVVLSHWRDGVCVASTPIELTEVSALIGVLADALGDAIDLTGPASETQSRGAQLLAELRVWLKPRLAQIVELRAPKDATDRVERTASSEPVDLADRVDTTRSGSAGGAATAPG